tara:strand:- start:99 stop:530 length:432 start_codon:yes stop_codon:yes gene_type:complete
MIRGTGATMSETGPKHKRDWQRKIRLPMRKRRINHVNRASPTAPAASGIPEQGSLLEFSQPGASRVFARLAKRLLVGITSPGHASAVLGFTAGMNDNAVPVQGLAAGQERHRGNRKKYRFHLPGTWRAWPSWSSGANHVNSGT